ELTHVLSAHSGPHRFRDDLHVLARNLEQSEPELIAPCLAVASEREQADQGAHWRFDGLTPQHASTKWAEASTHVGLINRTRRDDADRGEHLETVFAAKLLGRRIVSDPVARRKATQRASLAVADLHEVLCPADADVLG